jgi:Fe-Mn family superoxide dismutase
MEKFYELPKLNYAYSGLAPAISEQQLFIHHQKHHRAYVSSANAILEKLEKARKDSLDIDMKQVLKDLSFQVGGHILHSLFWENIGPGAGGAPLGKIAESISSEFGSFERFKKEFSQAALSVEGSGWACLVFCDKTGRLLIMQLEKHNTNVYPGFRILMALDVFEHAYYLDYKNERARFVEAFWSIVDWDAVNMRLP